MGLSIHYNGKIKDVSLIPTLVDELKDICTTMKWNYHLFDNEQARGICFSPAECEPLYLTFSKGGVLCSPILLHPDSYRDNIHPATVISVKTQFAGIDAHIAIVKLLKYLKANYFEKFELNDEGRYWESDDEDILRRQFKNYQLILNEISEDLKGFEAKPGEMAESLAHRLERFLKERLQKR